MMRPTFVTVVLVSALGAALRVSAAEPRGHLVILGRASPTQGTEVSIQRCELGSDGQVLRFGCRQFAEGELNRPIALPPGHYRAEFSGTVSRLIPVRASESAAITLVRIAVPGAGARFFHDLNDARERAWLVGDVLAQDENRELFEEDCQEALPSPVGEALTRAACDALRSGEPAALASALIRIHPDATWSTLTYSGTLFGHGIGAHFENQGRIWINETPEPAGEISVFPGVYGAELTLPDGKVTERFGLLARET